MTPRAENAGEPSSGWFLLYDLALCVGILIGLPWLLIRILTQARYRDGLMERLTLRLPPARGRQRRIWVHAASAGEMTAALAWVEIVRQRRPDLEIVLSSTTTSGIAVARRQAPEVRSFILPMDVGFLVKRAFARIQPDWLVLFELELWPNLVRAASRRGVAIAVGNGRISERSARRYGIGIVRRMVGFDRVDAFAMQNDEYRERLIALGVDEDRIVVTGNLKIDGRSLGVATRDAQRARLSIAPQERAIVAGSTRPGEEAIVGRAFRSLRRRGIPARLIVAPRHLERLVAAERELASVGVAGTRWSAIVGNAQRSEPEGAIVVDTMGELAALYAAADAAIVGGTLVPGIGGHNVFEPILAGAPVIVGPHLENVRYDVRYLQAAGALEVAADESALERSLTDALTDGSATRRAAATQAVANARGAAARTLEFLENRLAQKRASADVVTERTQNG